MLPPRIIPATRQHTNEDSKFYCCVSTLTFFTLALFVLNNAILVTMVNYLSKKQKINIERASGWTVRGGL